MKIPAQKTTRRRFLRWTLGAGALGLAGSYPVFIERNTVLTNTYRIPVPNLPRMFSGFRVVHLTDLHHGFLVPLGAIRSVVERANAIPHDLTVCTGDYVHADNTTREIDAVWPVLAQLEAPEGVFSVLGNHDHWADTGRSQHWLEETGQDLRHRVCRIERDGQRLWVAGTGDLWEDPGDLDGLLRDVPEDDCRIVLAHNPDSADAPYSTRIDLFLSGHTHGGQVRIPFYGAPVLPVRNKTYSSGLVFSPKGTSVFISRGTGWAIYPVRANCYPEIAVLELVPA